ncbi:SDR family oxidoreductase [Meiothermus sp. CFH 77666]|uniref:SDR family oxidoreductase n=1 Tax=Meiothermus sp. CFH 77666 TaxID=2817942 RepID=UPI001AA08509|nr:SDR family oxidoreductase [Meiothermus sp. CFH 77666]MBO1437651.1 SDR family oxidoreductase [Meiothermus sp. CFH 77666]
MGKLSGKRALVIAAGQGIGRAIVKAFVDEGAEVTAATLHPEKLEGVCRAVQLDARDREALFDLVRGLQELDCLVNAQGMVPTGGLLEATDQDWEEAFLLNAKSVFWAMQAAAPGMKVRRSGCILNVASVAAFKAVPGRLVYASTKAALVALSRAAALELAPYGIRVNALCPGTVDTPSLRERAGGEEGLRVFASRQPLGRLGRPEEIAALAVYLASDEGAFATGGAFVVDGGMSL